VKYCNGILKITNSSFDKLDLEIIFLSEDE